jgi:uncharacterized membrane protein
MSERGVRVASAALALAGVGITGYLLSVRASGAQLVCSTGGCETVQSSPYAEVFGVPVAALGLGAYVVMLCAAVARGEAARLVGAVVALAAVAFGGYLLVVQLVVVHAVCEWCLASDGVSAALAALALLRLRASLPPAVPPSRARGPARASGRP